MEKRSKFGWFLLVAGILLAVLGVYTLGNPQAAVKGVVVIYGIAAIIIGIVDIIFYSRLERRVGFAPSVLMVSGIVDLIVGVLLLFNQGAGAWALSILFPVWFIAQCIGRLANLDTVRVLAGKGQFWFTLTANILGLVLGVLLLFRPFLSMVSLGYIIGIYILILGIGCIVGAFSRIGTER